MAKTDSLDEFLANVSEDGDHRCIVASISSSTSKKDGQDYIVIKYEVNDPSSPVDGEEFTEFFKNFNHVTLADYNEMAGSQKKEVREAKRRLRERLLSLGVPENELSGFSNWDSLTGREIDVTVETSTNGSRKFVNIRNVSLVSDV